MQRGAETSRIAMELPGGPIEVPFGGSYIESYKVLPNKELLWGLWVQLCKGNLEMLVCTAAGNHEEPQGRVSVIVQAPTVDYP